MSLDPEPLPHEPPKELQRAQEERLLRAWHTPEGWRYAFGQSSLSLPESP